MAALNKIAATSSSRQTPSELETNIANALYELETNIPDLKSALRPLQFVSAREVSLRNPSSPFRELYLLQSSAGNSLSFNCTFNLLYLLPY
jgi:Ribosomal protein S7e